MQVLFTPSDNCGPEYVIDTYSYTPGKMGTLNVSRNTMLRGSVNSPSVWLGGTVFERDGKPSSLRLTLEGAQELALALLAVVKAYEDGEDPEL